jgi:hypothetical protein
MRSFLGGLIVLVVASSAVAQVRGEVESVGFGSSGFYRPECWTPMVVRLDSQIDDTAEYRIEIHQRDLDFDHVIYVKEGITLNGHATQRWEICFLPEPTNGGLPDGSIVELQSRLRVYLTTKDGAKQLVQLPITSPVNTLEPNGGGFTHPKGQKLILYVADGSDKPATSEYYETIGQAENPNFVARNVRELPQSVLAYQAVDAVLWLHGDARALSEQGSTQLAALQQWVRQGGMLVICQPGSDGERQLITPFADMLPIQWQEDGQWKVSIQRKDDLMPLPGLAKKRVGDSAKPEWGKLKGPFSFARAVAKPNAVVDARIDWTGVEKDQTPYIARIPYGLGSVTWVAQDLGDKAIASQTTGWPYVWEKVFGWNNDTYTKSDSSESDQARFTESLAGASAADLGASQIRGVEFGTKGAGLITLAVFFFIAYWIVAGPGAYLYLVGKKRPQHSWTAFGFTALGATVLTVLVVRLVLRGDPEIRHASNVRMVAGQQPQPAIIYSRVGLYIPRDGEQQVSLTNTSGEFASYVTPMPLHPTLVPDNEFPANLDYKVPVRESGTADAPSINVPFRSTLKKLQAKWCGDANVTVRGNSVRSHVDDPNRKIEGTLDNMSGIDFKNVYLAFRWGTQDFALYIPSWNGKAPDNRIDIGARFANAAQLPLGGQSTAMTVFPGNGKDCAGDFDNRWRYYWQAALKGSERFDDLGARVPIAFPVLSFFDRLIPPENDKQFSTEAFTILRRGMRNLNMSQALEAGELVVLAEAPNRPLPYPMQVNGSQIEGEGTVFYQFAFPIERVSEPPPPATAPATSPAIESAAKG